MLDKKAIIIAGVSFIVMLFDQLTKFFVSSYVSNTILIIKGIFNLSYIKNAGAGFGILQNQQPILIFVSVFVVGLILFYYDRIPNNKMVQICMGLLLGGTIGNLIDRIRLGYVVDFIDFRIWPAFNIADSAITIGALGLCLYFIRSEKQSLTG